MDKKLYQMIRNGEHRALRREVDTDYSAEFADMGYSERERITLQFERLMALQAPIILPGEQIVLMRSTQNKRKDILSEKERLETTDYYHHREYLNNIAWDFASVIASGLDACLPTADEYTRREIKAIYALCDRYAEEATRIGRKDVVEVLSRVPHKSARSFREALQFFRILHFSLWMEGCNHCTVGRFDQYMYPYFAADLASGRETSESAQALLEDFFLSFNKDNDLYHGIQEGDNGQSLMLGGCDPEGKDGFNVLSRMCLLASEHLLMIDPKINIRISKSSPIEVYRLGSRLTAVGLGFPQYSNDDVVIPALIGMGYDPADAANYTVAACWEFIVPGVGYEVVNIDAFSFPASVDRAVRTYLADASDFEGFLADAHRTVREDARALAEKPWRFDYYPSPLSELMLPARKYQSYGIHGAGIASAADALAAIQEHIFEKKDVTVERLLRGLDTDFSDDTELLHLLRYESPKMGCDDDRVDLLATDLLDDFADGLSGVKNCHGGIFRPGTGTAMYYLWSANEIGATADGRHAKEPLGTNYSASLFAKIPGPVSCIRSFTKQHLTRVCNGGPLTLEFASSMFRDPEAINKLAELVRFFILRGGHQLQLNAVNARLLRDAQNNPENHRHLIVRIWGWSAYFVELDRAYQDHVLARQEYHV